MSPGNASARQRATDPAPDVPQSAASATAHAASAETPECASLAHIIDSRNHRPMLRLQALQILEGICRSLDHAHRNGCIHGDVRPEQVFVTAEGHVRLIGHGDAATPQYASCEVLEGAPPTAADDLFSAACTGYQLLAGESAFGTGTALEAEAAGRRPARIPHLPPGQWRALDHALAFRRAGRQADIETFLNELRSQYPGQSESDATASVPQLAMAGSQETRGPGLPLIAVGITGIAVLVVALGWWLLRTPEAPAGTGTPPVATGKAEAGRILRAEDAPVTDTAAASPQLPPANTQPMPAPATTTAATAQAEPGPADQLQNTASAPTASAPAPSAPAAARTQAGPTDAAPASSSLPASVGPPKPAASLVPLLAPRAVAPALPAQVAPAIALPATPAADSNIYMVPFSSLKVRRYVEPDYPRNSEGRRLAGWVDVSFGIDAVGRTTELQVTAAEPADLFDEAALAAARRWRFAPVEPPAGSAQKVRSEIRVRFIPD
ncbi:MAG: TonB family protein [Gammaproteobacteria bacterium]|nr:TonB family protein [Gammaproteobacteria bacterium]